MSYEGGYSPRQRSEEKPPPEKGGDFVFLQNILKLGAKVMILQ